MTSSKNSSCALSEAIGLSPASFAKLVASSALTSVIMPIAISSSGGSMFEPIANRSLHRTAYGVR